MVGDGWKGDSGRVTSGCGDLRRGDFGLAALGTCPRKVPNVAIPLALLHGTLALGDALPLPWARLANCEDVDLTCFPSRAGGSGHGDCTHAISELGDNGHGERGLAPHGIRAHVDPAIAELLGLLRGARDGSVNVAAVELQPPTWKRRRDASVQGDDAP